MKLIADTSRYLLKLEYDGSNYCGWQLQSEGPEYQGRSSIQARVEHACAAIIGRPKERFPVVGCSRTDAGVHAEEYYCHVDFPKLIPERFASLEKLQLSLNGLLPKDIAVIDVIPCDKSLHAIGDAEFKTYEYRILIRNTNPGIFENKCLRIKHNLEDGKFNVDEIRKGLDKFVGTHDFKAFAAAKHTAKDTVRTILSVDFELSPVKVGCQNSGHLLFLRIKGQGFLKQMVRNIVGLLVEIGFQQRRVEEIDELLGTESGIAKDRTHAGLCAPAHALYLTKVQYKKLLV